MGRLMVNSVTQRDYPVAQGVVLCSGAIYIGLNLLADLAQFVLDPRIRRGAAA
jgi:peptide/nickel transport system permease protein